MVRYTYNLPTPLHPLNNPDLIHADQPLSDAENAWVRDALHQRRIDIYAQLLSVRAALGLFLLVTLFMLGVLLITGHVALILTAVLLAPLYGYIFVYYGLNRNKEAVRIAKRHLQTDPLQFANPLTQKARIHITASEAIHCTMRQLDQTGSKALPLQIPGHWAPEMVTAHLEELPLRMAKVQAHGTTAVFESVIKGLVINGSYRKQPTVWTHLSDAEYILLAIGDLSINAESQAGLKRPNTSAPQLQVPLFISVQGLFICALSGLLDELVPVPGSGTWLSTWFLIGLSMFIVTPVYTARRIKQINAIRRFYQIRRAGTP